ncbi:hypothetical protein K492DRAFT_206540 [Lichtheimia hyalospora FSU 10163]|nr:hypothetical protein K492DRAFT_206540 [Lichtheimia hyalospora FSU 10163]
MSFKGFWSLQLTPGNSYSQIASSTFQITMAAVTDSKVDKLTRSSVCIAVDNTEYVLCTLVPGQIDQQELDLIIVEGEEVCFTVKGESTIHMSGNYLDTAKDEEDDEELPINISREELLAHLSNQENLDGEIEAVMSDESEEMDIDVPERKRTIRFADKVQYADEVQQENKKDSPKEKPVLTSILSNNQNKQIKRKAPSDDNEEKEAAPVKKPKAEQEKPKKKSEKIVTHLPSGITIEESKVGQGASVKKGNKIGVRYIGRIKGGKVFDKNVSGKPFFFALGRQEVIKGWDEGITGMKLGGERKLTIPPALAYGKRGSPPLIPPNATLVFEIKLISIN